MRLGTQAVRLGYRAHQKGQRVELRDYLRLARARWLTLATFFILGVGAAGSIAATSTQEYTAAAEVFVVTQGGASAAELVQSAEFSQQQVRSYSAVAVRPIVLDPVIERLGLNETADQLARRVTVSSPLNTQLMSIAVTDPSPQRAAEIANAISDQLADVVSGFVPRSGDGVMTVRLEPIRSAVPPVTPSAPDLKVLLGMGIVGGLVAGVFVVALRESLNTKVRSAADLSAIVTVTQLGTVAFDPQAASHPLLSNRDVQTPRAEAFRQIRTNIRFVGAVEPHTLLAVTSSIPGEGKSTTAINLALALAAAGDRVCLVEADLRRPRLAEYLGLEGAVGLTTVLVGDAAVRDVVQPWGGQGLAVLLSGKLPPNPSELLGSERMLALLDDLESAYDVVVIDCPPLVPVTDGALIAKACGGAVLVVGSGKVDRAELELAVDALQSINTPILGTILNFVPPREVGHHGYGYESAAADGRYPRRTAHAASSAVTATDEPSPSSAADADATDSSADTHADADATDSSADTPTPTRRRERTT